MHTPWFFKRLGIEPTDDSKAVRRAYAVELKKIDQETQADEFETLRQAYELARKWCDNHQAQQAATPFTVDTPFTAETPQADTETQSARLPYPEAKVEEPKVETPKVEVPKASTPPATVNVSYGENYETHAEHQQHSDTQIPPQNTAEVSYATATPQVKTEQRQSTEEFDVELCFNEFIKQIKAAPQNAKTCFLALINSDAMIAIDARMQFELKLVAWLHKNPYPYAPLFEAAIEQFHWHQQLPNHHNYQVSQWLRQVMEQWQQWQTEKAAWRKQVFSAIHKNSWLVSLNEQSAFSLACSRYPLFMRFWANEDRINGVTAKKATWKSVAAFCFYLLIFAAMCFRVGSWMEEISEDHRQQQKTIAPVSAEIKELRAKELRKLAIEEIKRQERIKQQQAKIDNDAEKLKSTIPKPAVQNQGQADKKPVVVAKKEINNLELNPNVVSFKMSPALCKSRVELIGRWGALYKNQANYQSFENEAITCINEGWWPKGNTKPQEYLSRLQAAWLKPNTDNASLEGLEREARNRHQDPKNDLMMMCDQERPMNPFIFPLGAGCVALAATYQPPKIHTFKVSPELCQLRSQTKNWHFDQGQEWNNYLSYKQEVLDCVVNGWWPDRNHKRHISGLKKAWQETKK